MAVTTAPVTYTLTTGLLLSVVVLASSSTTQHHYDQRKSGASSPYFTVRQTQNNGSNATNSTTASPLPPSPAPINGTSPLPDNSTDMSPSPAIPGGSNSSTSPSPVPQGTASPVLSPLMSPSPAPLPPEPNECSEKTTCGDCLAEGCHWCAFPEEERCEPADAMTCHLYRSPGQGCIGILQLNLNRTELIILFSTMIVLGIGLIMLGHRIIKPIIFLVCAGVGFLMGASIMYWIMAQTAKQMWPVWVFGAVCAIGAGFMSLRWLKIGVCLIGAITGVLIAMLVFGAVEDIRDVEYSPGWAYGSLAIGAATGALLALLAQRIILIIGTSFLGSYAICRSVLYFSGHEVQIEAALTGNLKESSQEGRAVLWLYLTAILIMTFAGIYYQCRRTQGKTYDKGRYRNQTETYENVDGPPSLQRAPPPAHSGTVAAI